MKPIADNTVKMPQAILIELQGIPVAFVDVPVSEKPTELMLARVGELQPFMRGVLTHGTAIVVLPPEVAAMIRSGYANEIAKQKAAAAAQGH